MLHANYVSLLFTAKNEGVLDDFVDKACVKWCVMTINEAVHIADDIARKAAAEELDVLSAAYIDDAELMARVEAVRAQTRSNVLASIIEGEPPFEPAASAEAFMQPTGEGALPSEAVFVCIGSVAAPRELVLV